MNSPGEFENFNYVFSFFPLLIPPSYLLHESGVWDASQKVNCTKSYLTDLLEMVFCPKKGI